MHEQHDTHFDGVPDDVVAAIAAQRHRSPPLKSESLRWGSVTVGDLRIVEGAGPRLADRRVALVACAGPSEETAQVWLVHTAAELATGWDAVVAASAASAPYVVVVQTDLRGVVWTSQLGRCVGRLDDRAFDAVKAVAARAAGCEASAHDERVWYGSEMCGPIDGRWVFKAAEGDVLRRLAGDCTETLLTAHHPKR